LERDGGFERRGRTKKGKGRLGQKEKGSLEKSPFSKLGSTRWRPKKGSMPLLSLIPSISCNDIPLSSNTFSTISNNYLIDTNANIKTIKGQNTTTPVSPSADTPQIVGIYECGAAKLCVYSNNTTPTTTNNITLNDVHVKNIKNIEKVEPFHDAFLCKESDTGLWKLVTPTPSGPLCEPATNIDPEVISVCVKDGALILGRKDGSITSQSNLATKTDKELGQPRLMKPLGGGLLLACYAKEEEGQITTQARVYDKVRKGGGEGGGG
jgi:hypothetical protein